jgi:hypothetical protein
MNGININSLSVVALSDTEIDEIEGGFAVSLTLVIVFGFVTLFGGGVATGVALAIADDANDPECDCGE